MERIKTRHYVQFLSEKVNYFRLLLPGKEVLVSRFYGDTLVESRNPEGISFNSVARLINKNTKGFRFYDINEFTDEDGVVSCSNPGNISDLYNIEILKDKLDSEFGKGLELKLS